MQYFKTIIPESLLYKRIYGVIALLLLITFVGRVCVICINGSTALVKSQQLVTDDKQEQDDKQENNKFDNKQLAEFTSPKSVDMRFLPAITLMVSYPLCLVQCVKAHVIAIITPPPDLHFS